MKPTTPGRHLDHGQVHTHALTGPALAKSGHIKAVWLTSCCPLPFQCPWPCVLEFSAPTEQKPPPNWGRSAAFPITQSSCLRAVPLGQICATSCFVRKKLLVESSNTPSVLVSVMAASVGQNGVVATKTKPALSLQYLPLALTLDLISDNFVSEITNYSIR